MIKPISNYTLRLFALLTLIVAMASLNAVLAQGARATTEQQVARIRKLYGEVNATIAAGLKDHTVGLHHAMYTVGGEKDGMQWRAVGNMAIRTEYFFNCEPNDEEECGTDPRKFIVKITNSYRAAGDLASNAEYLYDDAGELIFALDTGNVGSEDGKSVEQRFYFAGGKLIRLMRGSQIVSHLTAEDQTAARDAQEESRRLRNIFALMVAE